MEKSSATNVKEEALRAIESLSRILIFAKAGYSESEYMALHKEVGLTIGQIQMGLLEPVYAQFPELDDLG